MWSSIFLLPLLHPKLLHVFHLDELGCSFPHLLHRLRLLAAYLVCKHTRLQSVQEVMPSDFIADVLYLDRHTVVSIKITPQWLPIFLSDVYQVIYRQDSWPQGGKLRVEPGFQSGEGVDAFGRQLREPLQRLSRHGGRENVTPNRVAYCMEHHLVGEHPHMVVRVRRPVILVERRHLPSLRQRGLQYELGEGEIPRRVDRLSGRVTSLVGPEALGHHVRDVSPRCLRLFHPRGLWLLLSCGRQTTFHPLGFPVLLCLAQFERIGHGRGRRDALLFSSKGGVLLSQDLHLHLIVPLHFIHPLLHRPDHLPRICLIIYHSSSVHVASSISCGHHKGVWSNRRLLGPTVGVKMFWV